MLGVFLVYSDKICNRFRLGQLRGAICAEQPQEQTQAAKQQAMPLQSEFKTITQFNCKVNPLCNTGGASSLLVHARMSAFALLPLWLVVVVSRVAQAQLLATIHATQHMALMNLLDALGSLRIACPLVRVDG
jgi:hypothetical protein